MSISVVAVTDIFPLPSPHRNIHMCKHYYSHTQIAFLLQRWAPDPAWANYNTPYSGPLRLNQERAYDLRQANQHLSLWSFETETRQGSVSLSLPKNAILSQPLAVLSTSWRKPILVEVNEVSTLTEAEMRHETKVLI